MRHFFLSPCMAFAAIVFAVSCEKVPDVTGGTDARFEVPETAPLLTKAQLDMSNAVYDFGLDMFSRLSDLNQDFIFSPMSLSLALSLCELGAEGETATQLADVQGLKNYSQEQVGAYYQAVVGRLLTADKEVTLSSGNALWADKTFPVLDSYKGNLAKFFNAESFSVDFSEREAVRLQVNKWGSDHTSNKIPEVLDKKPVGPVLLTNALYFNAGWGITFDEELLTAPFYGKATKDAQYFTKTGPFAYCQTDGCQFLSIPYGKGLYDFVVVLPDKGKTLADAVTLLQSANGKKALDLLTAKDGVIPSGSFTYVQLPRFEVSSGNKPEAIKNALIAMGAPVPFSPRAQFTRMSPVSDLSIEDIIQKAYVSVNEKGTEAAAVTVVEVEFINPGPGSETAIPQFIANRPFLFLIRETGSNTILFIGVKCQA